MVATLYQKWLDGEAMLPRFREAGDVTLDLFHRDARVAGSWINLFPREFELFWRLAEEPGAVVTKQDLLEDVWRAKNDPGTNVIAVHIARLRSKLDFFDLASLVATHPDGGYYIDAPSSPSVFNFGPPE